MDKFPKGARACFVGDSITANNTYLAHISGYYRENLPELEVEFYNCGISGGTLKTALAVFDEDIAHFEPTHVVIMSAINDACRHFLERPAPDRYDRMSEAFRLYKSRLSQLCERVENIGAEVILCTPMPYDEYLASDVKVLRGSLAAMLGYADYIRAFAKERGYELVDYHSYVTREITLSDEPLFNSDRVHPNSLGHYHMAKCFLASQGLEISENKELSPSVIPWHELTVKLRNIITAENFILHGDFSKTDEERMDIICSFLKDPWDDWGTELFLELAKDYPECKKKQKEYISTLKQMMKS